MTDYIGLGPVGELHPYLSKTAEGHAVIDAVRAVRRLPANAGKRWLAIGHSQGGHGAIAAAELAHGHAPEFKLVGTVALAPGAMFDRVYGGIDPIVTTITTLMGLYGATSEHPDIDVTDYVTPEADEVASSVFETGCLDEITEALIPVALAGPFIADPRTTEPARRSFWGTTSATSPSRRSRSSWPRERWTTPSSSTGSSTSSTGCAPAARSPSSSSSRAPTTAASYRSPPSG